MNIKMNNLNVKLEKENNDFNFRKTKNILK